MSENKEKNNLVIVTYDFTKEADCAMNHASYISKYSGAEVALVHIVNNDSVSKFKATAATVESVVEQKLEAIAKKNTSETGVNTFSIIRKGSIFSTIAEISEETKAKLVVLGTHGVRGMQHVLGAFALKVVTSSPAPVLIVQDKDITSSGYNPIVLPIDESVETKQKVNQAILFAKENKATVHIFSKYEKDEYLRIKVNGNANFVKNELLAEGIHVIESNEAEGSKSFSKEVIRYASSVSAGLIIITTKKEKEISDIFIADEDVKIVNNDPQIAVMCVNAKNYNILGSAISFGGFS
jgi:nucleotide-binding universal stress UspA family protein